MAHNRTSPALNVLLEMSFNQSHLKTTEEHRSLSLSGEISWKMTDERICIHCRLWISGILLNKQTSWLTNKYINT